MCLTWAETTCSLHPRSLHPSKHPGGTTVLPAPPRSTCGCSSAAGTTGLPGSMGSGQTPGPPRSSNRPPCPGTANRGNNHRPAFVLGSNPTCMVRRTSFSLKPGPQASCLPNSAFIYTPAPPTATPNPHPSVVLVDLSKPYLLLHSSRRQGTQLLCPGMWWVNYAGCVASPMPDECPHLRSLMGQEEKAQGEFYLHISWHKWA